MAGSTQVTLSSGEAAEIIGTATIKVKAGTAWVAGKLLLPGSVHTITSDAKFGGPIHIEALSGQETVPLVGDASVTLEATSCSKGISAAAKPGYSLHVLNAQQVANKRYPASWLQAAEDLAQEVKQGGCPSIAVAGSKGVGKSTLARLLVNTLLNLSPAVAFLDTDCGQTELTVPGLVSLTLLEAPLFGPPHMHQQTHTRAHFIGDLSPQSQPARYISAVHSLQDWYLHQSAQQMGKGKPRPPLVINTHGWIKGLGLEVLAQVLDSTDPGHVLQLQTDNPNNNLPSEVWWQSAQHASTGQPVLCHLPSAALCHQGSTSAYPGWVSRQPPAEQRAMQWLAFAKQCLGQDHSCGTWDLPAFAAVADALAGHMPYKVPLSHLKVAFHHAKVPGHLVPQALNGAVVALTAPAEAIDTEDVPGGASVDAFPAPCLAVGIVRTVDAAKGLLYVLTPAPLDVLKQATTLEVGKLDLPLALLQTSNFSTPYVSTWSITADGTGAAAMKARNTLLRARLKGHT